MAAKPPEPDKILAPAAAQPFQHRDSKEPVAGPDLSATEGSVSDTLTWIVEGFGYGTISGWIHDRALPTEAVRLRLLVGDEVVLRVTADRFRADLRAEGMNEGRCAFSVEVPPAALERARRESRHLSLVPAHRADVVLWKLSVAEGLVADEAVRAGLRAAVLRAAAVHDDAEPFGDAPASAGQPAYAALCDAASTGGKEPRSRNGAAPAALWPFAEHVRLSQALEARFAPDIVRADYDHFLRWYIDEFGAAKAPLRVPMSTDAVAYLNETVTIGGSRHSPTRAMLWYLASEGGAALRTGIEDEAGYCELVYWWACERAPVLAVEDCLVTQSHVETLRAVPATSATESFALSGFALCAAGRRPELESVGSLLDTPVRVTVYFAILLAALAEPGQLRFVPRNVLDRFLGPDRLFDRLVGDLFPDQAAPLNAEGYRVRVDRAGFDLAQLKFRSVDGHGRRIQAAREPRPPPTPVHDVQVIGPLSRVSGIGAACRVSRAVLARTRFEATAVDFIVDNPQPALPDPAPTDRLGRARINLLHLNGDLLPNAFAYLPDVFRGAYNVGFFFWELSAPAACHALAMDLVDEIWVGSEYNRVCFAAHTHKPVVNVGLALLDPAFGRAGPDANARSEARARLDHRLALAPDAFAFFASYDALSYLQRKNPLGALRAFQDAFPDDADVCFVLKTHNAVSLAGTPGERYWSAVLEICERDPRVKLVDETLSFEALMQMQSACDCYVSLHRSEGFGLGLLEAMAAGMPVLCTGYSGNMDFCTPETAWLVDYDEVPVRYEDYAHVSVGHLWAEPRHASALAAMREVRANAAERQRKAEAGWRLARERYSVDAAAARYANRIDEILSRST